MSAIRKGLDYVMCFDDNLCRSHNDLWPFESVVITSVNYCFLSLCLSWIKSGFVYVIKALKGSTEFVVSCNQYFFLYRYIWKYFLFFIFTLLCHFKKVPFISWYQGNELINKWLSVGVFSPTCSMFSDYSCLLLLDVLPLCKSVPVFPVLGKGILLCQDSVYRTSRM